MIVNAIPIEVISAANELIQMFGSNLIYQGRHENQDVYQFIFPEDQEIGFPHIFLHKDGSSKVKAVTGPEAFDLLASLRVE